MPSKTDINSLCWRHGYAPPPLFPCPHLPRAGVCSISALWLYLDSLPAQDQISVGAGDQGKDNTRSAQGTVVFWCIAGGLLSCKAASGVHDVAVALSIFGRLSKRYHPRTERAKTTVVFYNSSPRNSASTAKLGAPTVVRLFAHPPLAPPLAASVRFSISTWTYKGAMLR